MKYAHFFLALFAIMIASSANMLQAESKDQSASNAEDILPAGDDGDPEEEDTE